MLYFVNAAGSSGPLEAKQIKALCVMSSHTPSETHTYSFYLWLPASCRSTSPSFPLFLIYAQSAPVAMLALLIAVCGESVSA